MTMLVGIFYAIKDRNKETMDTYYFGGKNMSPVLHTVQIIIFGPASHGHNVYSFKLLLSSYLNNSAERERSVLKAE